MQMKERLNKKSKWSWNHTTMYWMAAFWMNSTVHSWAINIFDRKFSLQSMQPWQLNSYLYSLTNCQKEAISLYHCISLLMTVFEWIHLRMERPCLVVKVLNSLRVVYANAKEALHTSCIIYLGKIIHSLEVEEDE